MIEIKDVKLFRLGKMVYDLEKKSIHLFNEIMEYAKSKNIFDKISQTPDFYISMILEEKILDSKLEEDPVFLEKKQIYQENSFILDGYSEKIKQHRFNLQKERWMVYCFSEAYPSLFDDCVPASNYYIKFKDSKSFLEFYASLGHEYKAIKLFTKEEGKRLKNEIQKYK